MEKFRTRNFCLVLYPDDPAHVAAMAVLSQGYKYAAILHDRDVFDTDDTDDDTEVGKPKKPHWHVVLQFPQARWNTALATELGITTNYIQQCRCFAASLLYLIHHGLPHKAQYTIADVFGCLVSELEKALQDEKTQDEKALEVLDILANMGQVNLHSLIRECAERGRFADLKRMGSWVPMLIEEHNADDFARKSRERELAKFGDFEAFGPVKGTPIEKWMKEKN